MKRDIAPADIINANQLAHDYARLYFRPRTPTQYRIEGIRRPAEIYLDRHAPMLFMFVMKSRDVLTRPDVHFSRGNMQVTGAELLAGDAAFATLDFRKIYHEGSYSPDEADIKIWRCAEVLCTSPLVLGDCLEAVVCRSDGERKTLLNALGEAASHWANRIRVVSQPGYFNAEYAFVESVDLNAEAVTVKFHPRRHLPMATWVELHVDAIDDLAGSVRFQRQELDLRSVWNFTFKPKLGRYRVTIWIDDELAYRSVLEYSEAPF